MLKLVTFTGLDDQSNVKEAVALSKDFPNTEWAILFSKNKKGVPRYPTLKKVQEILETDLKFSAHLCGEWVDDALKGDLTFLESHTTSQNRTSLAHRFKRIQFNMGKERLKAALKNEKFLSMCKNIKSHQLILGGNYVDIDEKFFSENNICPLFDASGGRGIETAQWIKGCVGVLTGYAGGIGPTNIENNLIEISKVAAGDYWIDMESGIRSQNILDFSKCQFVLEKVENAKRHGSS